MEIKRTWLPNYVHKAEIKDHFSAHLLEGKHNARLSVSVQFHCRGMPKQRAFTLVQLSILQISKNKQYDGNSV